MLKFLAKPLSRILPYFISKNRSLLAFHPNKYQWRLHSAFSYAVVHIFYKKVAHHYFKSEEGALVTFCHHLPTSVVVADTMGTCPIQHHCCRCPHRRPSTIFGCYQSSPSSATMPSKNYNTSWTLVRSILLVKAQVPLLLTLTGRMKLGRDLALVCLAYFFLGWLKNQECALIPKWGWQLASGTQLIRDWQWECQEGPGPTKFVIWGHFPEVFFEVIHLKMEDLSHHKSSFSVVL